MISDTLKNEYRYRRHFLDGRMVKAHDAIRAARVAIDSGKAKPRYYSGGLWPAPQKARGGEAWRVEGNGVLVAWYENPESFARRTGLVHEIAKREGWYGRHWDSRGWYCRPDESDEVTAPVVFQLPARNGKPVYMCGGTDPNNDGAAYLSPTLFDDLRAACSHAQTCAEQYAEAESRYQESWRKGTEAAELKRENSEARKEALEIAAEMRALRKRVDVAAAPKACEYLRGVIRDARRTIQRNLKRVESLRRDAYHVEAFEEGLAG